MFINKGRVFIYTCTLVLYPLSLDLTLYFSISGCWPFLAICQDLKVSKLKPGAQEDEQLSANGQQLSGCNSKGHLLSHLFLSRLLSEAKPIWEAGNPGRFCGRIFSLMLYDETKKSAFICGVLPVSEKAVRNLFPLPVSLWPSFPSQWPEPKCKTLPVNIRIYLIPPVLLRQSKTGNHQLAESPRFFGCGYEEWESEEKGRMLALNE